MFDELSDDYEYANAILNSDYSDFSGGDVTSFKKVYDKLPQDWKDKNSFGDIAYKIDKKEGGLIQAYEKGEVITDVNGESIGDFLKGDWAKWSKSGKNHWVLKDEMKTWLTENKGKYVKFGNKTLILKSYSDGTGDDRNSYPSITFEDPKSKQLLTFDCKEGKGFIGMPADGSNQPNANMATYLGLSHPTQLYDIFNDDFWGDEYLMAGDSLY